MTLSFLRSLLYLCRVTFAHRTGADSESHARLGLVFGKKAIKPMKKPLALASHRAGSLMTAEQTSYSDTGVSLQRLAHWEARSRWSLECLQKGAPPFISCAFMEVVVNRMFRALAGIAVTKEQVHLMQEQLFHFLQDSVRVSDAA